LQVTVSDQAKYSRFIARRARPSTSPLADALARVGDRWTLLVVAALLDGPRRFNELQDQL
jgi:DNA-binding HxlR family transcriptional regulator